MRRRLKDCQYTISSEGLFAGCLSKTTLEEEYKHHTVNWIADKYDLSYTTINKALKAFGIPKSSIADAHRKGSQEKYGVDNVFQLQSVKHKIVTTNTKNLGVPYPMMSKECLEKSACTRREHNDGAWYNIDTQKATCKERYGVEYYSQTQEWKDKYLNTCNERYGAWYSKTSECKDKVRGTWSNHDDDTTLSIMKSRRKLYYCDGEAFDSLPELAFWLFCKTRCWDIVHEPTTFTYIVDGITHKYVPDFKVGNHLIEIKGDHFIKDGTLVNPFDDSLNPLYAAKHQCMMDNGVDVWTSINYKPFVYWFESHYNKNDFIKEGN